MKSLVLITIFVGSTAFASDFQLAKNTKCKVFVKPQQSHAKIHWHGQCKNGFADGLGVVRYLNGSKVESIFYGSLKEGYWDSGALDTRKSGYVGGRFKDNEPMEVMNSEGVPDRNVLIHAFETASKAALQLSQEFKKQGNSASTEYYKQESEKLSQQMD